MSLDRTLQLRVQEIINASPVPIAAHDALVKALLERFTTLEEMAEATATISRSYLNVLAKATYNLPETGEDALFDVPLVIAVRTPDKGLVLIPKDQALVGQVRQWAEEGLQHHGTQRLRFKRAVKDLKALSDLDPETPWADARQALGGRKELESDQ